MDPRTIATAPKPLPEEEPPVLILFCPRQGGWHTGVWWDHAWRLYFDAKTELFPTHWLPSPPEIAVGQSWIEQLAWRIGAARAGTAQDRVALRANDDAPTRETS